MWFGSADPPAITVIAPGTSSIGEVAEGDTLVIRCVIDAIPNATNAHIYFANYSDGGGVTLLKSFEVEMMLMAENTSVEVNVTNVKKGQHSGEYICEAINAVGSTNTSKSIVVVGKCVHI